MCCSYNYCRYGGCWRSYFTWRGNFYSSWRFYSSRWWWRNTALVKDDLAIIVLASDAKSPDDAKKTLESKGYTFKSQKDVSGFGDIKVFEQAYDKDGMPIYGYVCEVDGSSYIVCAANAPSDWDVSNSDNPVNIIIKSIDTSNV